MTLSDSWVTNVKLAYSTTECYILALALASALALQALS